MRSRSLAVSRYRLTVQARKRFLAQGSAAPMQVRGPVLASWRRSREWRAPVDLVEPRYVREPDLGAPLARGALPVLSQLRENLAGQPVSVILADAAGVVLARMTADEQLDRRLDEVMLAPGFSYAEASVGTNGIGTALESGEAACIVGPEHYAAGLTGLASAGVPVCHLTAGHQTGAVGLFCSRDYAGQDGLLLTLVKTAAEQVTAALLAESTAAELALMQDYLRACRHSSGIVLAINRDLVMMNDHARRLLDQGDQEALLGRASEALAQGQSSAVQVDLPTGLTARLHCRPAGGLRPPPAGGGVVQVRLLEPERPAGPVPATPARLFLPALVGSGALWRRGSERVQESCERGEWLVLEGEPGVGKLALTRAVHQRRAPARRFDVFDAAESDAPQWLAAVRRAVRDAQGDLVIRHADRLPPVRAQALAQVLAPAQARPAGAADRMWIVLTQQSDSADLAGLLRLFPVTVALPPLRHHIEDLPELVQFFLGRLSQRRLTCSREATNQLMRCNWPGNVEQLWQVVRRIVQTRRAGSIRPADLPPECWTVSRRLLSPLETLERDAIVQALLDSEGKKARAAETLGLSRASIYRKIHEYGIIV